MSNPKNILTDVFYPKDVTTKILTQRDIKPASTKIIICNITCNDELIIQLLNVGFTKK